MNPLRTDACETCGQPIVIARTWPRLTIDKYEPAPTGDGTFRMTLRADGPLATRTTTTQRFGRNDLYTPHSKKCRRKP